MTLLEAEAQLEFAQRENERVTGLSGVVTDRDIAALRSAVEVAQVKKDGLTNQVALLDEVSANGILSQKRRAIRAPLDGVVTQVDATLGENVGRDKVLFRIVDLSEMLIEADVFENDVASVLSAQNATLTVEAYPGISFPARIVSSGAEVDGKSRALAILFSVANTDRRLVAGMSGRIYIDTGKEVTGITVPLAAVVDVGGTQTVYVKTGGEQFTAFPLQILERLSDRVVIPEGDLKEGDRVVVQGTYQIRMSKSVGN